MTTGNDKSDYDAFRAWLKWMQFLLSKINVTTFICKGVSKSKYEIAKKIFVFKWINWYYQKLKFFSILLRITLKFVNLLDSNFL